MLRTIIIVLFCLIFIPIIVFGQGLKIEDQVWDFGHVGIEFKLYHTFTFVNNFDVPVTITNINANCDCTTIKTVDTIIEPGKSALFNMTFETKDYFGPINKLFKIKTDHPQIPELEYFYLAIVGQWYNGLKPSPISLFFLPSKKSHTIRIPNLDFDELTISEYIKYNDIFTVKSVKEKAKRGNSIELVVTPDENLKSGTFHTTLTIVIQNESEEKTRITIPIKIVRY